MTESALGLQNIGIASADTESAQAAVAKKKGDVAITVATVIDEAAKYGYSFIIS